MLGTGPSLLSVRVPNERLAYTVSGSQEPIALDSGDSSFKSTQTVEAISTLQSQAHPSVLARGGWIWSCAETLKASPKR
uniref:Uncharacterized protein n=1 Tax=Peronospora matthiolae TaxID=2874970 RepID=A0AAV1TP80_9STRA